MAPQTPVQLFNAAVTAPALVERVQIVDASGNVLSTTTAPLAAGAATSARQDAAKAVLDAMLTALQGTLTTSVSNFPATQPVSGSVSVSNFPATQPVSGTVTATGPLTDTQLRATAVPVSGTFFQGTQPVSAASLPLPSGAATEATLSTVAKDTTLSALIRDGQLFIQDRHVRRLLEEVLLVLQNQNSILLALASSMHSEVPR